VKTALFAFQAKNATGALFKYWHRAAFPGGKSAPVAILATGAISC